MVCFNIAISSSVIFAGLPCWGIILSGVLLSFLCPLKGDVHASSFLTSLLLYTIAFIVVRDLFGHLNSDCDDMMVSTII